MATVSTVLGPVDTSELGFTLSHEHLATGSAGMRLGIGGGAGVEVGDDEVGDDEVALFAGYDVVDEVAGDGEFGAAIYAQHGSRPKYFGVIERWERVARVPEVAIAAHHDGDAYGFAE